MSNVLIIDDDVTFLDAVSAAMEQGHRDVTLVTATTAEQGVRLLSRQRFDAILSDFRMSGLNGMDLLKECAVVCPDTPVVLITGYGSSALEQDALNHGAYAVLQKPVDSNVIYSVVTRPFFGHDSCNGLIRPILPPRRFMPVNSQVDAHSFPRGYDKSLSASKIRWERTICTSCRTVPYRVPAWFIYELGSGSDSPSTSSLL